MTDFSEYPTITLAGQAYPVKPLVVKQLRIVVPAMLRLRNAQFDSITEGQFDDLVEVAYQAVCPCQQSLTRDAFTNLPIKTMELMGCIPFIAQQAGMMAKESESGEVPAGK